MVRTRQSACRAGYVLGVTGSRKTTLLKNIITQDLARVIGTPNDPHRLPMVIFDGKGDLEFFYDPTRGMPTSLPSPS